VAPPAPNDLEPVEPAPRRRLRRESSADQVATHVRHAIMTGQLKKGDRLRQDEIAEDLGVSRIPVREAIIALDREGWVSFEANRGAFVTGLDVDDVRDHYELRGLVLGLAARRVAESVTDEEVRDLETRSKAMRQAADVDTFSSLNERFLAKLLRLADSPRLRAALLVTPSIIPQGFFEVVPDGRAIQEKGVRQIVRHIKNRAPEEADQAMRTTLCRHGDAVVAAFGGSGLLVGPPSPRASPYT
jgi:DNA-binding GntR family transcriptional regulator